MTSNEIEETRLNTLGDLAMRAPPRVLLNSVFESAGEAQCVDGVLQVAP